MIQPLPASSPPLELSCPQLSLLQAQRNTQHIPNMILPSLWTHMMWLPFFSHFAVCLFTQRAVFLFPFFLLALHTYFTCHFLKKAFRLPPPPKAHEVCIGSLFKSTFMVSEVGFKDLQQLPGQWTNRCLYLQSPLSSLFSYQPWSSEVSLRFWAPPFWLNSDFIWDLFKGSILFGPYLVVFSLITH